MAKTSTLVDLFTTQDDALWDYTGATVSGGQLQIVPTAAYPSIFSDVAYDLTESYLLVEFVQNASVGTGTINVEFAVQASVDDNVGFFVNNGTLYFIEKVAGVEDSTSVTYSTTNHRWLRLRHAGTTIFWDVSADGLTWNTARSKTAGFDLTVIQPFIIAGFDGTEPTPGTVIFDNLNNPPTSSTPGGKTSTLVDLFTTQDDALWDYTGATVSSGQLQIVPTTAYPSIYSDNLYDLTESYLLVEFVQNANAGSGGIDVGFAAQVDDLNYVGFFTNNGLLYFVEKVAGVEDSTSVTYNATNHRWLRLRHTGTTIFWDVSADGLTWGTPARSKTPGISLTSIQPFFIAGYGGTEPTPGVAIFDNLNNPPTTSTPGAKTSTLVDTFGTQNDTLWDYTGAVVSGGQLQITPTSSYQSIYADAAYDLTESYLLVEFVQNANVGNGGIDVGFAVGIDDLNYVGFFTNNGTLYFIEKVAGVEDSTSVAYNATNHRWLRLRHTGSTLFWDVSADGLTWGSPVRSKTPGISLTNIQPYLIAGYFGTEPSPGVAIFDNINTPPTVVTVTGGWQLGLSAGGSSGGVTPPPPSGVQFPRLGACVVGGPQIYDDPAYQAELLKVDIVIFGMYPGWGGENGETPADIVDAMHAAKPGILLGNYTIMTETNPSLTTQNAWRTKIEAEQGPGGVGDWYLYDASGAKVVPFPSTWGINISLLTDTDSGGDNWPQWKAKWDSANIFNADFDIWYCDNCFEDPPADADWNRNGVNDGTTSSTVKDYYRDGYAAHCNTAKALQPGMYVMANVDSDMRGNVYPGGINIPQYINLLHGGLLESLTGESWSVEVRSPGWAGMMQWYHAVFNNMLDPKIIMFSHNQWDIGDWKTHRYMFASCLLNDGYYTPHEQTSGYHDVPWFDEYDLDGTATTKWLGAAIDPPQTSPWSSGVYRREFEHGLALANPKGNGARTVTVGTGWRKVSGSRDSTNNGAIVTSVTLTDRDGIILVRN